MKGLAKLNRLTGSHGALHSGKGLISDLISSVTALLLAMRCVLGVLAFHLSNSLTTTQWRHSPDGDAIRRATFGSLWVTRGMALFAIGRNRSRCRALGAFVLIGTTLALGCRTAPVNDVADNTPCFGLDRFILDLLGAALMFIVIGKLFALRRIPEVCRPEWQG